ncbi:hypothetical protein UFOVP453_52 [uncultured Caudovirales phage]|uniref:Uncharacterized protein n=1 Tax=uncultured Caudovirales phage TaxID=2100421 RepID=A0A6J5MEF2_9CAUD|nr:hypothetical protein UFOVP453_52 [uncultured Caudovirales phage]
MQPITRYDEFVQYQFNKLIAEQQKTNELLQKLLDLNKPSEKGVESVERNTNDSNDKRKRR